MYVCKRHASWDYFLFLILNLIIFFLKDFHYFIWPINNRYQRCHSFMRQRICKKTLVKFTCFAKTDTLHFSKVLDKYWQTIWVTSVWYNADLSNYHIWSRRLFTFVQVLRWFWFQIKLMFWMDFIDLCLLDNCFSEFLLTLNKLL